MAATIKDVARLAGVSPSTVSRVLNQKGVISDETKQKIASAMERGELCDRQGDIINIAMASY